MTNQYNAGIVTALRAAGGAPPDLIGAPQRAPSLVQDPAMKVILGAGAVLALVVLFGMKPQP